VRATRIPSGLEPAIPWHSDLPSIQAFTATIATLSENHLPVRKENICHVFFCSRNAPIISVSEGFNCEPRFYYNSLQVDWHKRRYMRRITSVLEVLKLIS
jgi:hypothetical protein